MESQPQNPEFGMESSLKILNLVWIQPPNPELGMESQPQNPEFGMESQP